MAMRPYTRRHYSPREYRKSGSESDWRRIGGVLRGYAGQPGVNENKGWISPVV
jgi:hypothetical protein